MSGHPPIFRLERKFILRDLSLAEALAIVRQHPAIFREVYPPRAINNLYLDSPALGDYFAHVHGTPDRVKTRIRWYGPLQGRALTPTLERKIKRGEVSGKVAQPLPPLHLNGGVARADLDAVFDAAAMPEFLRATLRLLEPSLVNRYQRRYFESADHRFRLTVDWDLQFYGPHEDAGRSRHARPWAGHVILELKFAPAHAAAASAVTNALAFRMTRCSKYVLGIETLLSAREQGTPP